MKVYHPRRGLGLIACVLGLSAAVPGRADQRYDPTPVTPTTPMVLFDGKTVTDLSRFYTWTAAYGYEDPNRVFTVVDQIDGAPAVRISGQDHGGIVSRQSFTNYHLLVEYRWGLVTWHPRADRVRNSGILLHCQGEDGNYRKDFKAPWICSVEYEIAEGITGELLLLPGFVRGSTERILPRLQATASPGGESGAGRTGQRVWNPAGQLTTFEAGTNGRVEWRYKDPAWTSQLGYRGRRELERPVGQWNLAEVVSDGSTLRFYINGTKVNEGIESSLTAGRLLFQAESSEIFFRRIELRPLGADSPR